MGIYNFDKIREDSYKILEKRKLYFKDIKKYKITLDSKIKSINGSTNRTYDDVYRINSKEKIENITVCRKSIGEYNYTDRIDNIKLIDVDIRFSKFNGCRFKNIEFINCLFLHNIFENCEFENVVFKDCKFYSEEGYINIFRNGTILVNVRLINTNIEKNIFESVNFKNVNLKESNLRSTIIDKCVMKEVIICDTDLRSIKILSPKYLDLCFEDYYLSKFDEYTFIDKIDLKKVNKLDYIKIYKVYKDISIKFESNRLLNICGEYYYLSKLIERKGLKGISKLKSIIYWSLCGYGERPTYALITSLEIVLIFAILYMISGLQIGNEVINYKAVLSGSIDLSTINKDFMDSLYFSIVTFTTVGYGDITPIGFISTLLSALEMLLGVTMVGIWTATLARKITK